MTRPAANRPSWLHLSTSGHTANCGSASTPGVKVQWTPVVLPPAEDVGNVLEILNPPGVLIAIVTC